MWRRTNHTVAGRFNSHCCKTCAPDKDDAIKAFASRHDIAKYRRSE